MKLSCFIVQRKVGDLSDEAFVTWFGPNRNADYLSHGWLSTHIVRDSNGDEVVYYDWGPRAETIVSKKVHYCGYKTHRSRFPLI